MDEHYKNPSAPLENNETVTGAASGKLKIFFGYAAGVGKTYAMLEAAHQAYASSAANNGSGFEGLADNSYFWNITAGLAMFFGRYLSIIIQLAIAGSLMKKRFVSESVGTLKTETVSFAVILVFVVYIFAALTFFPALALGPIAEHLTLWS